MTIKRAMAAIILTLVIVACGVNAYAMTTGFETEEMDAEDKARFLSNGSIVLLKSDERKHSITCFDVSEKGFIALGVENNSHKYIYIYNPQGQFLYGYSFDDDGTYGVEWDKENLLIYFVRSDVAALVNKHAEILELRKISNSIHNTYRHYEVFATKRIAGKNTYEIMNDPGILSVLAPNYAKLIKTDQDGIITVLYDVSRIQIPRMIVVMTGVLIFMAIVISGVVKEFKKARTGGNANSPCIEKLRRLL